MSVISDRRALIIEALNKSIEIFTVHDGETFDEVLANGIRPIAEAAGLDRVVFYRRFYSENISRFMQIYRWDLAEKGLLALDDELIVLPDIPVIKNWVSITSNNGFVRIRESDMSADEKAFLSAFGVKSILIIPIFSHGEFWGCVALQNHTTDGYFDEDCVDLLYSAARLFANSIIRDDTNRSAVEAINALKRREKMANTLNRASLLFLSQTESTFEETMTAGIRYFMDAVEVDRLSIWRNTMKDDGLHSSQIYRWDRDSGGTTPATPGLEDVAYAKFAPGWEEILSGDEIINSPARLLPEAAMLASFGVISAFITPVFINNEFWGFALLEDRLNERYFDDDSAEMMRTAAFLCVNTVLRIEMEKEISEANIFNRTSLDAAPVGVNMFDENLRLFDSNEAVTKLFGCDRQYFLDHFYELSPDYQPDGLKSYEKARNALTRALNGENLIVEWTHRSLSGEIIPFEVTLTRVRFRGKYIVLAYQYDLRNIKKMEESINEQSNLLKIRLEQQELVSEISRGFISSGDSEKYVIEAITKIGRYHEVSQIIIFDINYGKNSIYPHYYWSADSTPPRIKNITDENDNGVYLFAGSGESGHMVKFDLLSMVKEAFPKNLPDCSTLPVVFCNDTATSPVEGYRVLKEADVSAFICAPLYVEGILWGVLTVEQFTIPRRWTNNEKNFIGITASTIAGVIMRDIYNNKLKEAVDKATAASRAKSEFLSNMSHEMRTPLNAITGMTSIGRNTADIKRKDYALEKIDNASVHLLGVINDVLDMSKIEANMLELSPVDFNFEKMLKQVVNVVNFRIEERHQKFSVYIDSHIPEMLTGDDQRLAQVITNLLGNAVKFTPEYGSIDLYSEFIGEERNTCTVKISVKDTGIGISPEQQKRLFSSFKQAESSTTRKYGGTGLGLSISKSIVEMMKGKIWIESELNKGSAFIFTFQMKRCDSAKQEVFYTDINWSDIRILAVDDDPDVLEYIKEITQTTGAFCDTALSGEEALKLVESHGAYRFYFIDWRMPNMDGIQLAKELKAYSPENSVIIMISAAEWGAIADEAKKAGVNKFLSKPLFPSVIKETITECLGKGIDNKGEIQTSIAGIFSGKHVLLAEDVEINREIVQTLFEPTLLKIDCAENGAEAVRMFGISPEIYDLILMDVQMPEMDGYEATQRIRKLEDEIRSFNEGLNKQIPIIAMTANVFKEDIDKCLEAGMNDHLGKPLDFDEVIDKLRTYLLES